MAAQPNVLSDREDVWARIAAPLDQTAISWRQDGRAVTRDGKYFARFVAYIDAQTVRERLDSVVPGEWDLTLDLLPTPGNFADADGEAQCAFKARIQILGVIREDVGQGKDYKTASSDAFKRAAVRFGIAHELYAYEQNWVQVDGDGKYAKPLEDPAVTYARKHGDAGVKSGAKASGVRREESVQSTAPRQQAAPASSSSRAAQEEGDVIHDGTGDPKVVGEPSCPKCGGRMWDNRLSKRNPRAPDYKCRTRSCDGVVWPPKPGEQEPDVIAADGEPEYYHDDRDLPF